MKDAAGVGLPLVLILAMLLLLMEAVGPTLAGGILAELAFIIDEALLKLDSVAADVDILPGVAPPIVGDNDLVAAAGIPELILMILLLLLDDDDDGEMRLVLASSQTQSPSAAVTAPVGDDGGSAGDVLMAAHACVDVTISGALFIVVVGLAATPPVVGVLAASQSVGDAWPGCCRWITVTVMVRVVVPVM